MSSLEVEIGLARPHDLDALWALYQRTYFDAYVDDQAGITKKVLEDFLAADSPYFPKNWQKYLEAPSKKRTVYVARHEGQIVGMVSPVFVDGKHRITALYVAPEMQGLGIGTKLMKAALDHHGNVDIYIGVASHVERLQQFYGPFGFKVVDHNRLMTYPPDPMSYIDMIRPAVSGSKFIS